MVHNRSAASSPPAPRPTRSVLEDIVLDLLLAAGFEHPDVNKPLILSGRRVVPDFRWPRQRLVLEADGAAWHDPTLDAERQALLEAHGERVLRVTWEQARHSGPQRHDRPGRPRPARRRADPILTSARPPFTGSR